MKELNEFHDANIKIEDVIKIKVEKNAVLEQQPENGFVFSRDEEEEGGPPQFYIARKDFWDKNGYFDDTLRSDDVDLPEGFHECMEACFEYGGDHPNPAELLHAYGFREVKM